MPFEGGARGVAVVTGASSGIGAATARGLAAAGFSVVAGARRLDRLREVAEPIGAAAHPLDVTDAGSVAAFARRVPEVRVLVNNAGGALGRDLIADSDLDDWVAMFELNLIGVARTTQAFLPAIERSGDGHIVVVGSIAGFEPYPYGAGYTAAKHAVRAFVRTLRQELLGSPVRVTEISPGLVRTEFGIVRFRGDEERARQVYEGMTPLAPEDVADCIVWAVTRPPHVNVDEIVVRPRDQATATMIHRRST